MPENFLKPKTSSQPIEQQTYQTAVPETRSVSDQETDDGVNFKLDLRSEGEILAETSKWKASR